MRLDGWIGGAHVLDLATRETAEWLDCERIGSQMTAAAAPTLPPSRVNVFGAAAAKRLLRKAAKDHWRLMAVFWNALADTITPFKPCKCTNYFKISGYKLKQLQLNVARIGFSRDHRMSAQALRSPSLQLGFLTNV